MESNEISIKADELRTFSDNIKKVAEDEPFDKNDMENIVCGNAGETYNSLFDTSNDTGTLFDVTWRLFKGTARFLDRAADTFEEEDYAIAKEISES